jgi:hypothetical protein
VLLWPTLPSFLRRWYGDHVPGSDMPGGASGAPAPGTGTGPTAYLERKLHRESWTGEMSVKVGWGGGGRAGVYLGMQRPRYAALRDSQ